MKLSLVKTIIENKLKGDVKLPDDNILADALYEAMYYICSMCVPDELVMGADEDLPAGSIIRLIQGGRCIIAPEYPDFTNTDAHLQIDGTLTYATIYLTLDNIAADQITKQEFRQKGEDLIAIFKANSSLVGQGDLA